MIKTVIKDAASGIRQEEDVVKSFLGLEVIRRPAKDNAIVNDAMESTEDVKVFRHRRLGRIGRTLFFGFEPLKNVKNVGLILYPGTLVDVRAYAPIAKFLAQNGYHAVLATPPFSLTVADIDLADDIINFGWKDEVKTWAISGHSQGGALACTYAKRNQGTKLKGVVLLAAYAGGDDSSLGLGGDLSETDYKVVSIYGSVDGIALYEDVVVEGAKKLPPSAKFVKIEGGNHTQFSYVAKLQEGRGKTDGEAIISLEGQQKIICDTLLEHLSEL
jgi:hypothetical protein